MPGINLTINTHVERKVIDYMGIKKAIILTYYGIAYFMTLVEITEQNIS